MADKNISLLPKATSLDDQSLMVAEQQGKAMSVSGALFKGFAQKAVEVYVTEAKGHADDAADYAANAKASSTSAAKSAESAAESADTAKEYSGNPAIPQNGTWWIWDADKKEYKDTGYPAKGNLMYPIFYLDESTGILSMYASDEYTGPNFRISDGYLEVVLSA